MKGSILLCSLLLSFSSLGNCFENICIGDEVMDNLGWSGYVTDIDTAKRRYLVQLPIDGSSHYFPADVTGKRVDCIAHICSGEFRKNSKGEDIEIVTMYSNDMIRIWNLDQYEMEITKFENLMK